MGTRKEAPDAASDAATENFILGGSTTLCCGCGGAGAIRGRIGPQKAAPNNPYGRNPETIKKEEWGAEIVKEPA